MMIPLNTKEVSFRKLKDKVVYLASPYSAYEDELKTIHDRAKEQERFEIVTGIAARLTALFHLALICPITTSHIFKQLGQGSLGTTWSFWSKIDLRFIEVSEAILVVMMDGWEESVGVTAEIERGRELNLPIYYLDIKSNILIREVD